MDNHLLYSLRNTLCFLSMDNSLYSPCVSYRNSIRDKDPLFRVITNFVPVVLTVFMLLRIIFISVDTYSPIYHQGNAHCSGFIFCDFLKPVNDQHSRRPGLTLNAFRYYLRSDLLACSTTHDEYSSLLKASNQNSGAFWIEAYRQGYKYVTYDKDYTSRHLKFTLISGPDNTPPWLSLRPIYGEPGDPELPIKSRSIIRLLDLN